MSMIWPPQSVQMTSTPSFLSALATRWPPEMIGPVGSFLVSLFVAMGYLVLAGCPVKILSASLRPIEIFTTTGHGKAYIINCRFADAFVNQRSNSARDKLSCKELRQKSSGLIVRLGSATFGLPVSLLADAWSLRSFFLGYRISRLCSSFASVRRGGSLQPPQPNRDKVGNE